MIAIVKKLITKHSNFTPGRKGYSITGIVLHTEGAPKIEGTADRSLFHWFNTNTRCVSAHYYMTFSGNIEQYVLDQDTAHQAGNWEVNLRTIGIEHQDNGYYESDQEKYTDEQYEASAQLVAHLCQLYDIPIQYVKDISAEAGITIHNQVPFAKTDCPNALDWKRIIQQAQKIATAQAQFYTGIFVTNADTSLFNYEQPGVVVKTIPAGSRVGVYEGLETALEKKKEGQPFAVQHLEPGTQVIHGWIDSASVDSVPPGFFFDNSVVDFNSVNWFRYYGSNRYALTTSQYGYSQHLHAGLDFGAGALLDVHAGIHGEVVRLTRQFFKPHGIYIRVAGQPYTIVYGHLSELEEVFKPYLEYSENATLENPISVTPDTLLGKVYPGKNNHLHLEVRYDIDYDHMILNTLLFFNTKLRQSLLQQFPHETNWNLTNPPLDEFVHEHNGKPWNLWHTPLDQPTLYRGSDVDIGPTVH